MVKQERLKDGEVAGRRSFHTQSMQLQSQIKQSRPAKGVKLYIKVSDNVRGQYRSLITSLNRRITVTEVPSLETCDIALVFCPVVSRLGTDVEAAFKDVPVSKPYIMVVMHFTIDPDYVVPDSKRFAKGGNTEIVDCLFSEDGGLLESRKNYEAIEQIIRKLNIYAEVCQDPGKKYNRQEGTKGTGEVKFYPQVPGNVTAHCHNLLKSIESEMSGEATSVNSPENCDVILAFCPVVSRLGTDVQAIVKNIPDTKPCILVVMHFTIDPNYVVPDSRRFVREKDMVVVDCLFSETSQLLVCSKNYEARRTIMENLKKHAKVWNAPSCLSFKNSNGVVKLHFDIRGKGLNDCCQSLIFLLAKNGPQPVPVNNWKDSDIIICLCGPTNKNSAALDTKGKILVVVHYPTTLKNFKANSNDSVTRKRKISVVDCAFEEDENLLHQSDENETAIDNLRKAVYDLRNERKQT